MLENKFSQLDLLLTASATGYRLGMRLLKAAEDAPREITARETSINLQALLDEFDPVFYGKALAEQLFGPGELRATLRDWLSLAAGAPLRLQIHIQTPELHAISWETLRDPQTNGCLTTSENTWFSRFPASQDRRPIVLRPKGELKALVVAANPSDLVNYKLAPVDANYEITRATESLAGIPTRSLGGSSGTRATLENILAELRGGTDILYVACHGAMLKNGPILFLEDDHGQMVRVQAETFVDGLAELEAIHLPRLVVLSSCESAGKENAGSLAALGPRLAEIGIPAIVAMQGKISMETIKDFMPVFFRELSRDGQIDRAMSVARSVVRNRHDAWMPVLFLRSISGRLWDDAKHEMFNASQVQALINSIQANFQPKPFAGVCPYKGLAAFQEKDADLFFGREKLVEDLAKRTREARVIFITGASGGGKSSLARAGLIPALKKAQASKDWLYATIKPGRDPFEALAAAFSRLKDPALGDYFRQNTGRDDILHRCAEAALTDDDEQRLLLFVDQFEEIFTQISREKSEAFVSVIAHAATQENGRVIVLAAVRSDFIPNCQTYPKLNALLGEKYAFAPVGAMQADELVSAIAQPALRVGLKIDPELVLQIINDMQGEPGALPLMQFALKDLFDCLQAAGGVIELRKEGYIQRGGIHKALERHADTSFNLLDAHEKDLACFIFGELMDVGNGIQFTRRIADLDELPPNQASREAVERVVRKLADARLVTTDKTGEKTTLAIAHEKLISAWGWLKELAEKNRDLISVKSQMLQDAARWNENNRDDSFLYRGARLANAREKLDMGKLPPMSLLAAFLEASQNAYADALEQEKHRADHLEELNRIALARQLASQAQFIIFTLKSEQLVAMLLATQSMKLFPNKDAANLLLNYNLSAATVSKMSHAEKTQFFALSPDGKYVLSGSLHGSMHLWEAATGKELSCLEHPSGIRAVAFSPDGLYMATTNADETRVFETSTSVEVVNIKKEREIGDRGGYFVIFGPDGRHLISNCSTGFIRQWDVLTGVEIAAIQYSGELRSMALSPDGRHVIAGGSDGTARVWEMVSGKEIGQISHFDFVCAVAFRPDGSLVASAGYDKSVKIWNPYTGEEIARGAHTHFVEAIAFSPDGRFLISGGIDSAARVWNVVTGAEIIQVTHAARVSAVAFSPDGRYVVTGSLDKTARVWEAHTGREIARMTHDGEVKHIAFSPDGKYVVSSSDDKTVRVWEAVAKTENARIISNDIFNNNLVAAAFSPDGRYILACYSAVVTIRDVTTSLEIARIEHDIYVNSVSFSSSGKYIISGSTDKTARVWESATGREVFRAQHDESVSSVALSLDEKYLLSGSQDQTVRVWEVETQREIARMNHVVAVQSVIFSRDGKYIGSWDNSAHIWQADTGQELAHITNSGTVGCIAFSPDSKYVITGCNEKTALISETETGRQVTQIENIHGVNMAFFSPDGKSVILSSFHTVILVLEVMTGKELFRMTHDERVDAINISADGNYLVSGSRDHTARVWDLSTGQEIARMIHDDDVILVSFSTDGKYVVSGSNGSKESAVRIWEWQASDLITNACKVMPRNLTRAEWQQYIGDALPYQAVCEKLPIENSQDQQ